MARSIYPSVDALLAAAGQGAGGLQRTSFKHEDSLSGGTMEWLQPAGDPTKRFVLKRFSLATDWVMRASEDVQARAVVAWQAGLLDLLPQEVVHGYVGCAQDGDGWAILLDDLSAALIPPGDDPISVAEQDLLLGALASIHAALWDRTDLAAPELGFCTLWQRYRALTPETSIREAGGSDSIPPLVKQGWDLFWPHADPVVARVLQALFADPTPLCIALGRFPHTIIHGDSKLGNLGITREASPRIVFLDWAVVGAAPPAVELAWYLAVNSARLPVSKEATINTFKDKLASRLGDRFDESWWQPQLDLGLLGGFLQLGWPKALGAYTSDSPDVQVREQAELDWWCERVRVGQHYLG